MDFLTTFLLLIAGAGGGVAAANMLRKRTGVTDVRHESTLLLERIEKVFKVVMAEGYFQHAEHYCRILNAMNQAQQQQGGGAPGPQHGGRRYQGNDGQQDGYSEGEGEGSANGYDGQPMDGDVREAVQ